MSAHAHTPHTPGTPTDLICLREAASLLPGIRPGKRMHLATLFRWCQEGKLPSWRIASRWFVSKADVLAMAKPVAPRQRPQFVPACVRSEEHRRAVEYLRARGLDVG